MSNHERFEVHFDDGQVNVAADLRDARTIARQRTDHEAVIWAVSKNDLGVGWRVDRVTNNANAKPVPGGFGSAPVPRPAPLPQEIRR